MARRFKTSKDALSRHKAHLPKHLARAEAARETSEAETLLERVHRLEADARRLGAKAEAEGDFRCAIAAVKTSADVIALLWRVAEERDQSEEVIVELRHSRPSTGPSVA